MTALSHVRMADRVLSGHDGPGAWPFAEGRVFGVVACNVGLHGSIGDVLNATREVWLLVAVALAVGEA